MAAAVRRHGRPVRSRAHELARGETLPFQRGRFNLLVFLHPQCPCSRATVAELDRLVTRAGPRLSTRVIVLEYDQAGESSTNAPLYRQAIAIPGVALRVDRDGVLARQFGAACSGQTLLYDLNSRLVFSGGITVARGHEGDNDGESAVLRLVGGARLATRTSLAAATPVYGCPLFSVAPALSNTETTCRR